MQSQLTTAQQERDISLANLSALRTDIQDLKVTNLQLEQGQQFLTTSLAKKGGMSLQVIGAKIAPLPEMPMNTALMSVWSIRQISQKI